MADIVERLRYSGSLSEVAGATLEDEAAVEIERLRSEKAEAVRQRDEVAVYREAAEEECTELRMQRDEFDGLYCYASDHAKALAEAVYWYLAWHYLNVDARDQDDGVRLMLPCRVLMNSGEQKLLDALAAYHHVEPAANT